MWAPLLCRARAMQQLHGGQPSTEGGVDGSAPTCQLGDLGVSLPLCCSVSPSVKHG